MEEFLHRFSERLLEQSFVVVLLVIVVAFQWRRNNALQKANDQLQSSLVESVRENTTTQLRWADKLSEMQNSIVTRLVLGFSVAPGPRSRDSLEPFEHRSPLTSSAPPFDGTITQRVRISDDTDPPTSFEE